MSATCPEGHVSQTADYCDQCGAALTANPAAAPAQPKPPPAPPEESAEPQVSPDTKPSVPAEPCPACQTPRVGSDRFCEGCGYNFATGEPAPPPSPVGSPTEQPTAAWEALVEADRGYFERVATEEVQFPERYQPRRFALQEAEIGIGRHSATRGTRPQIDLSGAPEDPAISHVQAILLRQDDGSYALVDPGSSNGTTLNDDPNPISPNAPVPLADGDRIHVGAWTTVTIHRREP